MHKKIGFLVEEKAADIRVRFDVSRILETSKCALEAGVEVLTGC
jgi:hypothetical protein